MMGLEHASDSQLVPEPVVLKLFCPVCVAAYPTEIIKTVIFPGEYRTACSNCHTPLRFTLHFVESGS